MKPDFRNKIKTFTSVKDLERLSNHQLEDLAQEYNFDDFNSPRFATYDFLGTAQGLVSALHKFAEKHKVTLSDLEVDDYDNGSFVIKPEVEYHLEPKVKTKLCKDIWKAIREDREWEEREQERLLNKKLREEQEERALLVRLKAKYEPTTVAPIKMKSHNLKKKNA